MGHQWPSQALLGVVVAFCSLLQSVATYSRVLKRLALSSLSCVLGVELVMCEGSSLETPQPPIFVCLVGPMRVEGCWSFSFAALLSGLAGCCPCGRKS